MTLIEPNVFSMGESLVSTGLSWSVHSAPLLAMASAENAPMVLERFLVY